MCVHVECLHVHVCVHTCVQACTEGHVCMCMCVHECMHVCVVHVHCTCSYCEHVLVFRIAVIFHRGQMIFLHGCAASICEN